MRLSSFAAASLALAIAAFVPLESVAAGPIITVENVESRNSVNGCGFFRFDADIVTKDWPAGMPHVVKYRWARSNNHAWGLRTITIGPSGKMHVRAHLDPRHARTGFAWVHVYSPTNFRSARVGFSNSQC
ncbi:MAG TPA: hypothetical protein VGT98_11570 [Candidatus Elarobacter sp.]|nr:hypothetical protein [Candidatus Elarobacter sp.]